MGGLSKQPQGKISRNYGCAPILLLFSLMVFFLLGSCGFGRGTETEFAAKKGTLDLREWDPAVLPIIPLHGEWGFFWNRIYAGEVPIGTAPTGTASTGSAPAGEEIAGYISVPSTWYAATVGNSNLPRYGHGTYVLEVLLPEPEKKDSEGYAVRTPPVDSAFCITVNGERLFCNGTVGEERDQSVVRYYSPGVIDIPRQSGTLHIAVSMSNYHYPRGGMRDPFLLGTGEKVSEATRKAVALDFVLFGALLVMGLYHAVLYLYRRVDIVPLFFALICTVIAVRVSVTGEGILYQFSSLSWRIGTAIEYISWYATAGLFVLYIHALFPNESSQRIRNIILIISILFSLFVLFTPIQVYTWTIYAADGFTFFVLIFVLVVLFRAARKKSELALIFLTGTVILVAAVVNDLFFGLRLIHSIYLAPLGLFIFLFTQALLLSKRFSESFTAVENLSNELNELNLSLEDKVQKRTEELVEANREIRYLSIIDPLTNCYNRRYIDTELEREIGKVRRYGHLLSIILLDLDHFKRVNDSFGHQAGDTVLVRVANIIDELVRENVDWVARYGGEEFLIVLPETDVEGASVLAERIRKMIEKKNVMWEKRTIPVTASFGVTGITQHDMKSSENGIKADSLIKKADILLYEAKHKGRNRVSTEQFG